MTDPIIQAREAAARSLPDRIQSALADRHTIALDAYGAQKALGVMKQYRQLLNEAVAHFTTPTEASAPVQPEPDAGEPGSGITMLGYIRPGDYERISSGNSSREIVHANPTMPGDVRVYVSEALSRTQPSTAQPSQGEAVAWVGSDGIERLRAPAPVDAGATVAAKGVINPPTYWKRQYKHGAPTYVLKQLHFPSKQVGLEWVRIHRPDEVAQAEEAWADEVPSFDWNIWADPAAIRQSTLGEPKEGGENG